MKRMGLAEMAASGKMLAVFGVFMLTGCTGQAPFHLGMDTRSADEAAIRRLDDDWVKAAQTKQPDAWMAFYADDAAVLPPNDNLATAKGDIRKSVSDLLGLPELEISWTPVKVEVARAGDIAYMYGTYDASWNGTDGKRVMDHGKVVEVWKKQSKGVWRCVVDTWNTDLPAAAMS